MSVEKETVRIQGKSQRVICKHVRLENVIHKFCFNCIMKYCVHSVGYQQNLINEFGVNCMINYCVHDVGYQPNPTRDLQTRAWNHNCQTRKSHS